MKIQGNEIKPGMIIEFKGDIRYKNLLNFKPQNFAQAFHSI